MLHVTLRGLQGNVVRLLLTAFAVMLGASFVTGTFVLRGGIAVRNGGAPSLGFAFTENDPSFTLVSGRGPAGPGEVAVDTSTLDRHLKVGDRTRAVIGDQARQVTITGEVHDQFGLAPMVAS